MSELLSKRIALVLGGGGIKGFAHLGVLRALAEHHITPVTIAGTSIGALIAASTAAGVPLDELVQRAVSLRRRDLFRINHMGMVIDRIRNPAIYLEHPLRTLIDAVVPHVTFDELHARLLVNTVDLARGTQVVWGLRGLRDVSVAAAVYASCALPGFFPPGQVGGRLCVDGGVMDNLPVAIAGRGMDAVIAVDVGSTALLPRDDVGTQGFAAIYMRAATTMMHELQIHPLQSWGGAPMILIRPAIAQIDWFDFSQAGAVIEAGYVAAVDALRQYADCVTAASGVFPRKVYRLTVDDAACIGCGLCATLAPDAMVMNERGRASVIHPCVNWSPADGDFVRQCPTDAIHATPVA